MNELSNGRVAENRLWTGYFVAFCGIDGSGKTTQVAAAHEYLATTADVLLTKQPTDLYRNDADVRALLDMRTGGALLIAELALLSAFDRARHVRTQILPALAGDGCVITDRYVYSTYSYFMARGINDLGWLKDINRLAPEPDLTIYIDVEPQVAATRIIARDGSSRKREELDLVRMTKVRDYFLEQPWGTSERFQVVDGSEPQHEVTAGVLRLLKEFDPR
jgi:dTMP kinase